VFFYVSVVWMLSHTYPPIIVSSVYVALVLAICFKRELFNLKTILGLGLASGIALAIVFIYFADVIQVVSQTVYPGQRVSRGGEVPWQLWLSTFFPYINHSNYQPLLATNICELGVVTSLLPIMAMTFVHHQSFRKDQWKVVAVFLTAIIIMSLWMLGPISPMLAKLLLLDRVPGARLLWALGLMVNFLALYMLVRGQVRFNLTRVVFFSEISLGANSSFGINCHCAPCPKALD
jgi:hypothetical protein